MVKVMKRTEEKKDNIIEKTAPLLGIILIAAVWFLLCKMEVFNAYVLPSPQKVSLIFWNMVKSGEIFIDIAISFERVIKGFSIAFVLAFLLGMFVFFVPIAQKYYEYIVNIIRQKIIIHI